MSDEAGRGHGGGGEGDHGSDADAESLQAALGRLQSTRTIRERCTRILTAVEAGESPHFRIDGNRLDVAADRVVAMTRARYPTLQVPYHSRWRHFEVGGLDRHTPLRERLTEFRRVSDRFSTTRALIDLAVVSVLLDAGAGAPWRYREASTGLVIGRSEGLALASLAAFEAGVFSSDPREPCRVDAAALQALQVADLATAFQVGESNPLVGLAGRVALMNALGRTLAADPVRFGVEGRPGGLIDGLLGHASDMVSAAEILDAVLQGLAPIWPSGQHLDGVALGDCWPHRHATEPDYARLDAGWVPFHKLSQWLTYSLLEPLEWAGIVVNGLDALTGLPEYRNGGLLVDTGVIGLRDPSLASRPLAVGSEVVIEWRALTVALIDAVAERVRSRLAQSVTAQSGLAEMPLAAVLEGGTWAAGRELARELRGGEPPLVIVSDGTVF